MRKRICLALSFITLIGIFPISLEAWSDQCLEAIKYHDGRCNPGNLDMRKNEKCRKAIEGVEHQCKTNNPWKLAADAKRAEIKAIIREKAEEVSDPASLEVAYLTADLQQLNEIVRARITQLFGLKEQLAIKLANAKSSSELVLSDYKTAMNDLAQRVNNSGDLDELFNIKKLISEEHFSAIELLAEEQNKIVSARVRLSEAEDRLLSEASAFTRIDFSEFDFEDLKGGSQIADAALHWQIELQRSLVAATAQLQSATDQKMSVLRVFLREGAINDEVKERLATANHLSAKTLYLEEVQMVIQQMTEPRRSDYFGMPYLSETIAHARRLKGIIEFCDSPGTKTWHASGCTRAQQFRSNVDRVLGSSTVSTISFATTTFDQSSNDQVRSLNEALKRRASMNDLESAANLYDNVLKILERDND